MNKLATLHQIEMMELAELNARTEFRLMESRLRQAEARAAYHEKRRRAERRRHNAEIRMLVNGLSVLGCLATAVTCIVAAPWWTAVAPVVFAGCILRKAGW